MSHKIAAPIQESINIDAANIDNQSPFFYKMLGPNSTEFTQYYLTEESTLLHDFVISHPIIKDLNFVVVGAGPLLHLSLGSEHSKGYVAVDPLANLFINDLPQEVKAKIQEIKILNKHFEELTPHETGPGNSLYIFTFNVVSYLKDFEAAVNNIIKEGDILFVSYWNNNKENEALINGYFNFVYGIEFASFRKPMVDTNDIDCTKITHFKRATTSCGKIVKTTVIYT